MPQWIPNRKKCVRIKDTHLAIPLKEFAKLNSISLSTVRYWLRVGDCKGYKTGGRWYIYKKYE